MSGPEAEKHAREPGEAHRPEPGDEHGQEHGADTVAWFHCFSGIAGDMALGALVDAGADVDEVREMCERLPVTGWELEATDAMRNGIGATLMVVRVMQTGVVRT